MFGIGKWFKTQTEIGRRLESAKDRLEALVTDPDFRRVFNLVKKEVEAQIDLLETNFFLSGVQRGERLLQWLGEKYPDTIPYASKFLSWISAWVDLKKAAGLFK